MAGESPETKQSISASERDAWRSRPEHWRGPFYFNRKDKATFLLKPNRGPGVTLNFARPGAYLVLAVFVLMLAGLVCLLRM